MQTCSESDLFIFIRINEFESLALFAFTLKCLFKNLCLLKCLFKNLLIYIYEENYFYL